MTFIVKVPQEKIIAYFHQVKEVLRLGKIDDAILQLIIGRLERISYTVPHANFTLNRIQHSQMKTTSKFNWANIPSPVQEDITLFPKFLNQATARTSIKNLVFRCPPTSTE